MRALRFLPLLVSLLFIAALAPAQAQAAGGASVKIVGFPTQVQQSNNTQAVITFQVVATANAQTCTGGGSMTANLEVSTAGNATLNAPKLNPASFPFTIGQTETLQGSKDYTGTATLVLSTVRPVTSPSNTTVTVTATLTGSCTLPGSPDLGSPAPFAVSGKVHFMPSGTTVTMAGGGSDQVPGFELPLLALALVVAALSFRRRN
jgi:hypothetical protein